MSPKKKICFLTHNLKQDNGAGVFSLRLIRGLSDFEVITFTHEELFPLWRFLRKLKMIGQCDIIHALDAYPYGILAVFTGFLLGKKVIITAVGTGAVNQLYHPFYSIFLKWAYRRANRVVAVSNFTKREILKKVPDLKIEVINHGVDFERFVGEREEVLPKAQVLQDLAQSDGTSRAIPQQRDMRVVAKFGAEAIESVRPYILSVGTLRWRKGYHRSIPAFAEVSKVFPDLKYVIVGKRYKDDYSERLEKLIRDLKLEGRVIILENIDNENELIRIYKNAELFCLMAQTANRDMEGFGLVFLEAAAAGLPVVGTAGSGVEDAVLNGKNGILLEDTRESKVFAGAIMKILQNKTLASEMSKESSDFAKRSSWESKVAQYRNLIYDKQI